jgi:hypothetical protein
MTAVQPLTTLSNGVHVTNIRTNRFNARKRAPESLATLTQHEMAMNVVTMDPHRHVNRDRQYRT